MGGCLNGKDLTWFHVESRTLGSGPSMWMFESSPPKQGRSPNWLRVVKRLKEKRRQISLIFDRTRHSTDYRENGGSNPPCPKSNGQFN